MNPDALTTLSHLIIATAWIVCATCVLAMLDVDRVAAWHAACAAGRRLRRAAARLALRLLPGV
ncbi:hypothetical protein [Deinococcus arenicola]|uniref:Uncharacterized protein n=1 Tax=Deinococcus arenicola TaxID=2994950 RepID=A0ABU4DUN3_9DEIO|nr:hypothetical protein [Deinococcus sp. ZS9-10]MDV6376146.1 hypothetical protein [Deinococcus sp. ZS9-10]